MSVDVLAVVTVRLWTDKISNWLSKLVPTCECIQENIY